MRRWHLALAALVLVGLAAAQRGRRPGGATTAGCWCSPSRPSRGPTSTSGDTPNLDALLDESAVASLSVRGVVPPHDAGDAYATISAGTRARGVLGSGQVFEPDEDFFGVPAGSVFRRNTGRRRRRRAGQPGPPGAGRQERGLDYDAEIGALGEALGARRRAPRGDRQRRRARCARVRPPSTGRPAIALIDLDGVVPAGAVSGELLTEDPLAPFGVAL